MEFIYYVYILYDVFYKKKRKFLKNLIFCNYIIRKKLFEIYLNFILFIKLLDIEYLLVVRCWVSY